MPEGQRVPRQQLPSMGSRHACFPIALHLGCFLVYAPQNEGLRSTRHLTRNLHALPDPFALALTVYAVLGMLLLSSLWCSQLPDTPCSRLGESLLSSGTWQEKPFSGTCGKTVTQLLWPPQIEEALQVYM